jgi:phage regulator Rha-like protein
MKTPHSTKAEQSAAEQGKRDFTGTELLELVPVKAEPRVDSRLLAKRLGTKHKSAMALIDRYAERIKAFGQLPFKKEVGDRAQGGGNAECFALLNEDQAFFVLSLSRNTERVVALKVQLVKAFSNARRAAAVRQQEYLPSYHAAQDIIHALANGSPNERFIHINTAKLINKAVGIGPGQRPSAALPTQSLLAVAHMLFADALKHATDHHQIQGLAKKALAPLANLTAAHQLENAS